MQSTDLLVYLQFFFQDMSDADEAQQECDTTL